MIVADVNLIAYLLLGGPEQQLAERVLERDPMWAGPLLWRSEFRSVLAAYMRQRALGLHDAIQAAELAHRLLAGREYAPPPERVLELVHESTCSAYDCEYVAVAELLDVPLVTADRKLLRAFPTRAVSQSEFVANGPARGTMAR